MAGTLRAQVFDVECFFAHNTLGKARNRPAWHATETRQAIKKGLAALFQIRETSNIYAMGSRLVWRMPDESTCALYARRAARSE